MRPPIGITVPTSASIDVNTPVAGASISTTVLSVSPFVGHDLDGHEVATGRGDDDFDFGDFH
jgi:hypothetical protein